MSWSLKVLVFGSGRWIKHSMDFSSPQGTYFLEKYDQLPESEAFGQKLRYFKDQNGPKGGNTKMLQLAEKIDEKMRLLV